MSFTKVEVQRGGLGLAPVAEPTGSPFFSRIFAIVVVRESLAERFELRELVTVIRRLFSVRNIIIIIIIVVHYIIIILLWTS